MLWTFEKKPIPSILQAWKPMKSVIKKIIRVLIYCRVSSERQKNEGHGLDSQEQRCRAYAAKNGWEVEMVFYDSYTGHGDFMNRPAMSEMLRHIDERPDIEYIVIFDDLKRFARDTEFHIKLRSAFKARSVELYCLNYKFDESPEGRFVELIFAAQGELEREQNRRQVIQKQKARLERGYWSFYPPPGYVTKNDPAHGKILTPKEPEASIIKEALEGFATGRFQEQIDVQAFLESREFYADPKKKKRSKYVHLEQVKRLLTRIIYAGYIQYDPWEVSMRKGHHQAIISLETYNKIQERLVKKCRTHTRMDCNPDFPLRGFILCSGCNKPMTASWSKGRTKKYPYYKCQNRGCSNFGKDIRRERIEDDFLTVLESIEPKDGVCDLVEAIVLDIWNKRMKNGDSQKTLFAKKLERVRLEKESLLNRIVKAQSESVIKAYEQKIEALDYEEQIILEKLEDKETTKLDYGTAVDTVFEIIKKPSHIWGKGSYNDKRLVLKLVFADDLVYDPNSGYGTAELSIALKLFRLIGDQNSKDVETGGIEPPCIKGLEIYLHSIVCFSAIADLIQIL